MVSPPLEKTIIKAGCITKSKKQPPEGTRGWNDGGTPHRLVGVHALWRKGMGSYVMSSCFQVSQSGTECGLHSKHSLFGMGNQKSAARITEWMPKSVEEPHKWEGRTGSPHPASHRAAEPEPHMHAADAKSPHWRQNTQTDWNSRSGSCSCSRPGEKTTHWGKEAVPMVEVTEFWTPQFNFHNDTDSVQNYPTPEEPRK